MLASAAVFAAAPLIAFTVDRAFGEPPARSHPVVWMGTWLAWWGARIAPAADAPATRTRARQAFGRGAAVWCASAAACVAIAAGLEAALLRAPTWLAAMLIALLLKPLFSWRLLRRSVLGVEAALAQSLAAGRTQLAQLVSRDVRHLDAATVRASALESLAENLNDSLVAPLFWFALLGLPGAALFRFANTADAMWGYPGVRQGRDWEWAGKWAAHADDVLAWAPARVTALLIALFGRLPTWRTLRAEAARTPSPNGGWPMGALALALGVRLVKPGVYVLNAAGREPQPADTARASRIASRAAWAASLLCCLAAPIVHGGT